jgi:hypothetical protein
MKVAEDVVVKAAVDAAVMKTIDQGATTAWTTMGSVGSDSGSSPSPAAGSKRAAAPGGSTTPSEQFRCAWKPRCAEQVCNPLLFV